jgi:hypothetical protein
MRGALVSALTMVAAMVCAPSGACLRLSDCATGDVCSAGACVPVVIAPEGGAVSSSGDDSVMSVSSADAASTEDAPDAVAEGIDSASSSYSGPADSQSDDSEAAGPSDSSPNE